VEADLLSGRRIAAIVLNPPVAPGVGSALAFGLGSCGPGWTKTEPSNRGQSPEDLLARYLGPTQFTIDEGDRHFFDAIAGSLPMPEKLDQGRIPVGDDGIELELLPTLLEYDR
jgi:hypothetical protein